MAISRKKDHAKEFAIQAAAIARDDNAEDIIILDMRALSEVTDYFVICTGSSDRQMRTVADDIAKFGKQNGFAAWHVEGKESADWILVDFVDVVVHVFDSQHRKHYDLELLWGEAPRVDWKRTVARRAAAKKKKAEEPSQEK